MKLVTDNPNGLSVTFTEMAGIKMGDLKKVIVPKLGGGLFGKGSHPIRKHVPVADVVLDQLKGIADRVELSQDEKGVVSYTVCLDPAITKGQKDFSLSGQQIGEMGNLITEVQAHIPISKCGSGAVHIGCLKNGFSVEETVDRSTLVGDQAEIGELYDAAMHVLTPMAVRHGGSFEIVDIYDASEETLKTSELDYLSEHKTSLGFELVVFGSCSGCAAFGLTYGQAPKKIADFLKSKDSADAMQVRKFTQPEDRKPGQALIFK